MEINSIYSQHFLGLGLKDYEVRYLMYLREKERKREHWSHRQSKRAVIQLMS